MEQNPKVRVIFAKGPDAELQNLRHRELEPQAIKIRAQNSSNMFIDIAKRTTGLDRPPTKVRLSSRDNTLFSKNLIRIAVSKVFMTWITPNINIRNNVVGFRSSNTGATIHTVTIPEGFYNTRATAMQALVDALNSASGASFLTFAFVINPLNPLCADLLVVGGTYNFDLNSLMVRRGRALFNLPTDQTLTVTKKVGAMHLQYTRDIAIFSNVLTRWTKNPNQSNVRGNNTLLFTLFSDLFLGIPGPIDVTVQNLVFINYKPDQDIVAVDFFLTDEFGDELYVPSCAEGTDGGFFWDLVLHTET